MPIIGPIITAISGLVAWLRALTPLVKIPLKLALLVGAFLVIPLPDWVSALPGKIGSMPAAVQYMLYLFQLGFGVTVIVAAYALRMAWAMVSGAIKGS